MWRLPRGTEPEWASHGRSLQAHAGPLPSDLRLLPRVPPRLERGARAVGDGLRLSPAQSVARQEQGLGEETRAFGGADRRDARSLRSRVCAVRARMAL